MGRRITLSQLVQVLAELDYLVDRTTAVEAYGDTTLQLADGQESLGAVFESSDDDGFESADERTGEVMNSLPREAVGEPYQSEGEG